MNEYRSKVWEFKSTDFIESEMQHFKLTKKKKNNYNISSRKEKMSPPTQETHSDWTQSNTIKIFLTFFFLIQNKSLSINFERKYVCFIDFSGVNCMEGNLMLLFFLFVIAYQIRIILVQINDCKNISSFFVQPYTHFKFISALPTHEIHANDEYSLLLWHAEWFCFFFFV